MKMAAVASTIGMQSVTQVAFQQLKLQQARQNAERAEMFARTLQTEAANAQREADRAQQGASELAVRSSQAQGEAGRARQGLAMVRSVGGMQESLKSVLDRVPGSASVAPSTSSAQLPVPVVNTSGQVTGVVINTVA